MLTYTGADEVKGDDRPPAVPMGELLDALDVTAAPGSATGSWSRHPLQPFDPRNFTPGDHEPRCPSASTAAPSPALGRPAGRGARRPPFLAGPLAAAAWPTTAGLVSLADLQYFFAHPVRAFVRRRLEIALPWEEDEPSRRDPGRAGLARGLGDR